MTNEYWKEWEKADRKIDRWEQRVQQVRDPDWELVMKVWKKLEKNHPEVAARMRKKQSEPWGLIYEYMTMWHLRYYDVSQKFLIEKMVKIYGE